MLMHTSHTYKVAFCRLSGEFDFGALHVCVKVQGQLITAATHADKCSEAAEQNNINDTAYR